MRLYSILYLTIFLALPGLSQARVAASAGDYALRAKIGPAFNIKDYEDQFRVGAEFDYELGYALGINFLALGGVGSNSYRFQMIPALRYDYLYIGPASFYGLLGMGYGRFKGNSALDSRVATGVNLPLGNSFELNSDIGMYWTLYGMPGSPVTFEWLLGFGKRFP